MSTESPTNNAYMVPDGVLIGHLTPGTAAWEEARTGLTVTATEIAAVVGLSPWMSRFTLWHKKAGLQTPPFEMTPAIEWGSRLEDAVALKWEEEHPGKLAAPAGTWQHRDREWQRATPDRLIYPQPAVEFEIPDSAEELLEVKTSPFGDEWGPDGDPDGVPIHYRCQVMWQMDTLGLKRTRFAVLIGGWDYREYTVDYDEAEAKILRDAAETFLNDVRDGNRPPIDGADDTYKTIRVQPDHFDDIDVEIPAEDADRYHAAQAAAKAATAELTAAKGLVLDHIGPGRRAVVGERRIAYRIAKPDGTTKSLTPYKQKDAA
ncbi:YqaJ viral recombinase family protein [Streptomyces sp. NBC_00006]|uniref:YqaJ viral recombinase family nuclease n=1 Tax=Streptomyces sp. NBC_00006 TaxID=2975619 RepID=UPI002254E5E7|nr:YqaJ viral recombinase family protein [Streptomyces sp. NBC_00006]MCX5529008.1 YqaJ viral recombinase family protein [Streptomyces sp. NBC_00006]MCX5537760.1 YqaJ viral recombinase family protein [Streptomyces sp. NBC_00006]